MLHLTNGDSTAGLLHRIGITGSVIAWRDILHEGPTPAGLALEAMSDVRARFLASIGADGPTEWRAASLGETPACSAALLALTRPD